MASRCIIFVSRGEVNFAEQLYGKEATEAIQQEHPNVWVDNQGYMRCHATEDIYFTGWKVFRYKIDDDK